MFAFIRGSLHSTTESSAIIEANGIGYEISLPSNAMASLPPSGEELFLHLSFVIRENSQALYGFTSLDQKALFETFLAVSGVGPKMALQLVGNLSLSALQKAIRSHDITAMCKVPGVGKKTAQRLLLEIKDKVPALAVRDEEGLEEIPDGGSQLTRDAMSALINLGYTQGTSEHALKKALGEEPDIPNLPALITKALQHV